jgi:hypothetical protein
MNKLGTRGREILGVSRKELSFLKRLQKLRSSIVAEDVAAKHESTSESSDEEAAKSDSQLRVSQKALSFLQRLQKKGSGLVIKLRAKRESEDATTDHEATEGGKPASLYPSLPASPVVGSRFGDSDGVTVGDLDADPFFIEDSTSHRNGGHNKLDSRHNSTISLFI